MPTPASPIFTGSPPPRRQALARARPLLALASALLPLAAVHGSAQAQVSPYYIGALASISHDSNVFRRNQAVGDTYYSVGLIGGVDQPIGRQRVYASGIVRNSRYSDQTQLNNTSYGVNAGIDWATVNRLSGTLSFGANQSLANYGDNNLGNNNTTRRNIEKSNQALARVQFGAASRIVLESYYTHRNLSYSDPVYASSGLSQDAISGGVRYQPSAALSLGVALRFTKGEYDVTNSKFDRRDVDLTATWIPTGLSTVSGRLSFGKQDASDTNGTARDFSGATGYVSWIYQPTGRLRFNTWVSRDTGAETSFFNTTPNTTTPQDTARGNTSDITNTVAVDASYAATGKIGVNAGLRFAQRSLERGDLEGSDRVYIASLGATYQALRNVLLSCNVARETRSTSSVLSTAYGSTFVGCTAQATIQ